MGFEFLTASPARRHPNADRLQLLRWDGMVFEHEGYVADHRPGFWRGAGLELVGQIRTD